MTSYEPSTQSLFWNDVLAKDLQRFLNSRLKCAELAADLTHETYIRLDKKVKDSPPDNARALAFRIALNLAIDYQRKKQVRSRYESDLSYDVALELSSNQAVEPDKKLIAQQRMQQMKQALDALPVKTRTVFYLHSVEGLKYSEIAERMGISVSGVNQHLAKAMTFCASKMEK